MAKNKITDLRDHLFATLEALRDDDKPMDLDRARAVAEVARVVIDSAKVEVDMLKVTGEISGTGFIPAAIDAPTSAGSTTLDDRRRLAAVNGGRG